MKTIFIPVKNQPLFYDKYLNECSDFYDNGVFNPPLLYKLIVNGIVNQELGDKANCKEIVEVESAEATYKNGEFLGYNENPIGIFETVEGYLITYLESDMIASKNDLLNCFNEGRDSESLTNFQEWFNENF